MSNPVSIGDKIVVLIDGGNEAIVEEVSVANPKLRLPDAFYAAIPDGKTWCLNNEDEGNTWRRA